ncbi:hypothetical protein FOA52_007088 [Chlamydomonas sp. UWO 241]|nr:hypothetical protein FOA52_007088 [Chlamydomonas sp. UWO 241]
MIGLPIRGSPFLQGRRACTLLPRPSVALLHRTPPSGSISNISGGGSMGKALGGSSTTPCRQPHVSSTSVRAHAAGAAPTTTPDTRPRVALVVTDFDETCTAADTTGLLMAAAARARTEGGTPGTEGLPRALAENYAVRYAQLMAVIMPDGGVQQQQRQQLSAAAPPLPPFDLNGLSEFLRRLSEFDAEMNAHAADAGATTGLTLPRALECAAGVALRDGVADAFARAARARAPVHVLSVNWCADFVAAALAPCGVRLRVVEADELRGEGAEGAQVEGAEGARAQQAQQPEQLEAQQLQQQQAQQAQQQAQQQQAQAQPQPTEQLLLANRLVLGADGAATGQLRVVAQSAVDKAAAFEWLRARHGLGGNTAGGVGSSSGNGVGANASSSAASPRGLVAYVGDSTSDLLALLAADVGIVIGSNRSLRRVCARFGVALRPLSSSVSLTDAGASSGVLYTTNSWHDVSDFLFGCETGSGAAAAAATAAAAAAPAQQVQQAQQQQQHVPRVLVVAGSDSGGGAGVQADLKTIMACGAFGATAITAVTAQNTAGVHGVHMVPTDFLMAQIDAVLDDIGCDVMKTGMLPDANTVRAVAAQVRRRRVPTLVVDPVMFSTSGSPLADDTVAGALLEHLAPLATLLTPNIPEARALLVAAGEADAAAALQHIMLGDAWGGGGASGPVHAEAAVAAMERAARAIVRISGCRAVLIKGGHLALGISSSGTGSVVEMVTDVLFDRETGYVARVALPRVTTRATHGTGCTLASAMAAHIARGAPLEDAVRAARAYVQAALASSAHLTIGAGPQHPFNHGYMLHGWGALDDAAAAAAAARAGGGAGAAPAEAQQQAQQQQQGACGGAGQSPPGRPQSPGGGRVDAHAMRAALRVYAVTDPSCNARAGRGMAEAVAQAVAGGATIIQIREKDVAGGDFLATARAAYQVCSAAGVPLIINDRVDIALACGPDVGVHIGQEDLPVAVARQLLGPGRILGVSTKTPEQAIAAVAGGADYLGCGAVHPTATKVKTRVIGLEGLSEVVAVAGSVPVVAIGGMCAANAADAIAVGAAGIAVVRDIFLAKDGALAAAELRAIVDAALATRGERLASSEAGAEAHACSATA